MRIRDTAIPPVVWAVVLILASRAPAQDIPLVKSRLFARYLQEGAPSQATVQGYIDTIQPNGSWLDINYSDDSRNAWEPVNHLYRVEGMAKAFRAVGHFHYNSAAAFTACSNGLNYWYTRDPQSDNWWWNRIGTQLTLAKSLILLESQLTATQINNGNSILNRAQLGDTGQNLVWQAQSHVIKGLLQNSAATVSSALAYITGTIVITTAEGVQPDYSFQQHGALLYSGGYGAGFSFDTGSWANVMRDTSFAFAPGKIDLISSHLLDGQRWMTRGRMFDYGVHGRGITRKDITAWEIISPCLWMAELHTPRESEFMALYNQLTLTAPPLQPAVVGNKHFWHSDYMAHSRGGYLMSTRMYSTRNYNTDGNSDGSPINGEGKRSHNIAAGCTFIFRDGEEYTNIFGVWDWYHIPGTTVEYNGSPNPNNVRFLGTRSFVGGVSDGLYGMAAFDFARGVLSARKSWFYFDNEVVCLGAGITSSGANSIVTTLNQCLLRGEVTVKDSVGTRAPASGDWSLSGLEWAHHDDVGFILPGAPAARLRNQAQSNTWNYINDVYPAGEIDSKNVFGLWLDHGAAVSNGSYQYIVRPEISSAQIDSYAQAPPVSVHSNTSALQSAEHKALGILQAAFYSPGSVTGAEGLTVTSDKACLVMVRQIGARCEIACSNPSNQPLSVNLDLNRYLTGPGATWLPASLVTRVALALPSGNDAGRSVVVMLDQATPAVNPSPADGVIDVHPGVTLSWSAGEGAAGHHVYLGTSLLSVTNATPASPEFRATLPVGTTTFKPFAPLAQGVAHYWRIDEVPPVGPPVEGEVWSLTTLVLPGDFDNDLDVDLGDFGELQACLSGQAAYPVGCGPCDLNADGNVNQADLSAFLNCMHGSNVAADAGCLGG